MFKLCGKCKTEKHLGDFSKNVRSKDGYCTFCKSCSAAYNAAYREANKERLSKAGKDYYEANKGELCKRNKEYRQANSDKISEYNKSYYRDNAEKHLLNSREWRRKNKDKGSEISKRWRNKNKELLNAKESKRRASKSSGTPSWADDGKVKALFVSAKTLSDETGIPHEVDHVIPIVSPMVQSLEKGNLHPRKSFVGPLMPVVSGLHWEGNLGILTAKENRAKGNRSWPDMPSIKI